MIAVAKVRETPILKFVPPVEESKKVSVDDGFTAIPNELLDAILEFDFSNAQRKVVLAVIRKTLSWHKEMDWICNEQLAEIANLPDVTKASRTKNELIRMNVLIQNGRKIGLNLNISEWENEIVQNNNVVQNDNRDCMKRQSKLYKTTTTKETITKYKINNTPLPPKSSDDNLGVSAVADEQAVGSGEQITKPKNLPVDYQGVMEEFNLAVADTPIAQIRVMSDQRKRAVHSLAKLIRREFGCYTRKAFGDYFRDFVAQATARRDRFYFGGVDGSAWKADFDYLLRAKTFAKTVENSL